MFSQEIWWAPAVFQALGWALRPQQWKVQDIFFVKLWLSIENTKRMTENLLEPSIWSPNSGVSYISAIMTSEKQTLEDPSHDLLLYHLSSHLVRWPPVARCQALNRPMQSTPASGSLPKASPLSMLTCQALYLSLSMHLSMLLTTSISQPCWWHFRGAASSTCDHKT